MPSRPAILFLLLIGSLDPTPANAERYAPPRLEDGRPDLQGFWVASNRTPLIRPDDFPQLRISAAEAKKLDERLGARDRDPATPLEPFEFLDERHVEAIEGEFRSSIIVDPADGKMPRTARLVQRLEAIRAANRDPPDGPEQRPVWERCLGSTAAHPPMLSVGFTNMHQIVQTRDAVVFFSESLHEARIFRLGSRHPPAAIRSWQGDSIAWWEGDTLVVETKGFLPDQNRMAAFLISSSTVIVERFTRVSRDELKYVFTVSDPLYYTQPWTGETHYLRSQDPIFEDACHEGNYAIKHILEAGRLRDGQPRQTP